MNMVVLYPNLCYNKRCLNDKGTALFLVAKTPVSLNHNGLPNIEGYRLDNSGNYLTIYLLPSDSYMRIEANSEGPDEMPHNAAFHQGLHCLLRQKRSSEKEIQYFWGILTCAPQYMQWTIPS